MEKVKLVQVGKVFVPVNEKGEAFVLTRGPRVGQPAFVCKNESSKLDLAKRRVKSGRWVVSSAAVVGADFDLDARYPFVKGEGSGASEAPEAKAAEMEVPSGKGRGRAKAETKAATKPEKTETKVPAPALRVVEPNDDAIDEPDEGEFENEIEVEAAAQDEGTDEIDKLVEKLLKSAKDEGIDW